MQNDKFNRDMERLKAARRRTYERLQKRQQQIDERFDRIEQRLGRKFGKPNDTQQRIIEAALTLLQDQGLESLTQRKLATTVHMQAPALYWHFRNKEELVDHMAQAILDKEFTDIQVCTASQTWQDWLIDHMMRLRRAMLAYPDGARVVAGARLYPAVTLAKLLDTGLASLYNAGIDVKTARRIVTTATTYTFGYVIEEQAAPTEQEIAQIDLPAFLDSYPHLAKSLSEDDYTSRNQDEDYLAGLRWIVQGSMADRQ